MNDASLRQSCGVNEWADRVDLELCERKRNSLC
jgi:hypothetical protein